MLPRMPLALRILLHNPSRLAVSVAGILLAIILMFSQLGFRNGMFDSQVEMIRRLNGELFLVSRLKYLTYVPDPFTSRRVSQARACAGVQTVYPLYIEVDRSLWRNANDGSTRPIRVLAFNLDEPVFAIPEVNAHTEALKMPDTVLFDAAARDYYGRPQTGTQTGLARREVTVVGTFRLGTDFLNDGNAIMSDRNFLKFFPDRAAAPYLDKVMVAVVRLEPGADLRTVQANLRRALPDDVTVLTKDEFAELETRYWRDSSAIGYIFTMGLAVGFFIGLVICYQVLYSNVSNYLPQFATLKAMGFADRFLVGIVLQQGLYLALLAFVPGVAAAQVLFWVVGHLTGLLMFLTPLRVLYILALSVTMCMISGIIAVRRILTADPAEVFR
jgi:putative ABC transport system permease protein